jgi:dephospho-CoA kinase
MKVIAVVGMAGSGKSVLSEHLRERGIPVVRFGEIVLEEVRRRGLPPTPLAEQEVREDIRRRHGMDAMATLSLPAVRAYLARHPVVALDGLYSFSEYRTLRREFGDALVVVAVFSPRALRYARLATRRERPLTAAEAEARDVREIEVIEKGGPIALADFTLVNDGTPGDLLKQADALLATLLPAG